MSLSENDCDFTAIEHGLVHGDGRVFCGFTRVVLDEAESTRLAALVQDDARVQHFAELLEGAAQLVLVYGEGQVADVDGKGGRRVGRLFGLHAAPLDCQVLAWFGGFVVVEILLRVTTIVVQTSLPFPARTK